MVEKKMYEVGNQATSINRRCVQSEIKNLKLRLLM